MKLTKVNEELKERHTVGLPCLTLEASLVL